MKDFLTWLFNRLFHGEGEINLGRSEDATGPKPGVIPGLCAECKFPTSHCVCEAGTKSDAHLCKVNPRGVGDICFICNKVLNDTEEKK